MKNANQKNAWGAGKLGPCVTGRDGVLRFGRLGNSGYKTIEGRIGKKKGEEDEKRKITKKKGGARAKRVKRKKKRNRKEDEEKKKYKEATGKEWGKAKGGNRYMWQAWTPL